MDRLRDILSAPRANDIEGQTTNSSQSRPVKNGQHHSQNGRFTKKPITKNRSEDEIDYIGETPTKETKILKPVIAKRLKKSDYKKVKVISLGYPRDLMKESQNGGKPFKGKKQYSIEVKYRDDKGQPHTRNVLFGNVEDKDFYTTGDEMARLTRAARLRNTDNPLHQNFYRLFLLNSPNKTMLESYSRLREAMDV